MEYGMTGGVWWNNFSAGTYVCIQIVPSQGQGWFIQTVPLHLSQKEKKNTSQEVKRSVMK